MKEYTDAEIKKFIEFAKILDRTTSNQFARRFLRAYNVPLAQLTEADFVAIMMVHTALSA